MNNRTILLLKSAVCGLVLMTVQAGIAQNSGFRPDFITLRTGNIASSFPLIGVSSLFQTPYRPYTEVSLSRVFKKETRQLWEHELNIGYFYHRFLQHGIPVHYNLVRRFKIGDYMASRVKLGGGYLHSISAVDQFELNEEGKYEKLKTFGKPQLMFDLALEYDYHINSQMDLSLQYKAILQTPFIKSYVPLLPYNSLHLGLSYQLKKAKS